ncbi:MAG TPA: 1-deoxy-D-xylulose-5-phosphate reductoisomerase, partial [Marmoricola sp.]|nr:1-deoxy-D-xylulose-5-phosphate reductoisomerase [Marmoricola sp.]
EAGSAGGTAPAVYNAANEVCVQAFRDGRLPFTGIVDTVGAILGRHRDAPNDASSLGASLTIDDVLAADAWAREEASSYLS